LIGWCRGSMSGGLKGGLAGGPPGKIGVRGAPEGRSRVKRGGKNRPWWGDDTTLIKRARDRGDCRGRADPRLNGPALTGWGGAYAPLSPRLGETGGRGLEGRGMPGVARGARGREEKKGECEGRTEDRDDRVGRRPGRDSCGDNRGQPEGRERRGCAGWGWPIAARHAGGGRGIEDGRVCKGRRGEEFW